MVASACYMPQAYKLNHMMNKSCEASYCTLICNLLLIPTLCREIFHMSHVETLKSLEATEILQEETIPSPLCVPQIQRE